VKNTRNILSRFIRFERANTRFAPTGSMPFPYMHGANFAHGIAAPAYKKNVPFRRIADRWENGTQTTRGGEFMGKEYITHDCSPKGLVITNHGPRRFLVDSDINSSNRSLNFEAPLRQ
jgi:hypothetical protein